MKNIIQQEFQSHLYAMQSLINNLEDDLVEASMMVLETLKNKKKIFLCGNGGSASFSQHIATELTGRYKTERRGLAGIALTTDTSALTAIGNDYGFNSVFERQIEALAYKGDLLIGISTSGNSKNVLNALCLASELGCSTIGLSGKGGGSFNDICDLNIIVPSDNTSRIQEIHLLFGHTICQIVDDKI